MESSLQALRLAGDEDPSPLLQLSPAPDAAASRWGEPLPDFLVQLVFVERLPADVRVRCALVCRAWAHALLRGADAWRCWTRLDLSGGSGVVCTKCDAALEGAAALARGRLQELDLSDRVDVDGNRDGITLGALLRVLRSSPELRQLALGGVNRRNSLDTDKLRQLLAAAPPTLRRLRADRVFCRLSAESLPLLRAEPPFGPVRMEVMTIYCNDLRDLVLGTVGADGARSFGAAVAHAWVREIRLHNVGWTEPAALEAFADVLLARTGRVEKLMLAYEFDFRLMREYLPALARLLAGREGAALKAVHVRRSRMLFYGASEADVEPVCAALRRSTLTHVVLRDVGLTEQSAAALRQAAAAATALRLDLPTR